MSTERPLQACNPIELMREIGPFLPQRNCSEGPARCMSAVSLPLASLPFASANWQHSTNVLRTTYCVLRRAADPKSVQAKSVLQPPQPMQLCASKNDAWLQTKDGPQVFAICHVFLAGLACDPSVPSACQGHDTEGLGSARSAGVVSRRLAFGLVREAQPLIEGFLGFWGGGRRRPAVGPAPQHSQPEEAVTVAKGAISRALLTLGAVGTLSVGIRIVRRLFAARMCM